MYKSNQRKPTKPKDFIMKNEMIIDALLAQITNLKSDVQSITSELAGVKAYAQNNEECLIVAERNLEESRELLREFKGFFEFEKKRADELEERIVDNQKVNNTLNDIANDLRKQLNESCKNENALADLNHLLEEKNEKQKDAIKSITKKYDDVREMNRDMATELDEKNEMLNDAIDCANSK